MENQKPLQKSAYKQQIGEYFKYSMEWDFLDVVASVLDRIDFDAEDMDEEINRAIDDELIYTCDRWTILEYYQSPEDANWWNAVEEFTNDIYCLVAKIQTPNPGK